MFLIDFYYLNKNSYLNLERNKELHRFLYDVSSSDCESNNNLIFTINIT